MRRLTIVLALLVGGCAAGGVSHAPFKRNAAAPVRSIAMLAVPDPGMATVHNFGSFAGGIGAASSQAKYRDPLTRLLKERSFDFSREMHAAIADRLRRAGYRVVSVPFTRDNPVKLLEDYGEVPSAGADAILDVAPGTFFGYANVDILDSRFRPCIMLNARLVSSRNKETLYSEQILYGWTNTFMSATQLKAPEKFFYAEAGQVIANAPNTVAGLRAGVGAVADRVAGQLKP